MKICSHCGKEIMDEAVICVNCGCAVAGKQAANKQNEKAANPAIGTIMIIAGIGVIIAGIIAVMSQL